VQRVELQQTAPIVGACFVSECCGVEVLSAPDSDVERCYSCDKDTTAVLAWIVSSMCPEHDEHLEPIQVELLSNDSGN
jgi:hypothetical protein